jgi:hypothetical protein
MYTKNFDSTTRKRSFTAQNVFTFLIKLRRSKKEGEKRKLIADSNCESRLFSSE